MSTPKVKLPPRATLDAVARRFLKEGQTIYWAREMPTMYRLFKAYPSLPFWQAYELPFGQHSLNMLSWFERDEGKRELERAWLLWSYTPPPLEAPAPAAPQTLDAAPEAAYTAPVRRPRSVAEMLRS